MAWSGSAVMREWVLGPMYQASGTGYTGLDSDTVNVPLFNNTVVPDKDALTAAAGYNTGTWVTGNEVTDVTNWVAGGRALASKTFTNAAAGVVMFDAADLAGGGNVTLASVYGCAPYDNTITGGTIAKQIHSFNSFGGVQQVTAGTFTIIWNANGISRITV